MTSLNNDIYSLLSEKINSVETLQQFCKSNKEFRQICRLNKNSICKYLLEIYKVDYTDPTNFIYIINNKTIDDFKDKKKYKFSSIFKLYMKSYFKTEINCGEMNITSFPIYPNMIIFNGRRNQLTTFPIQPKMTYFYGNDNQLITFPVQPNMTYFYGYGS